MVSKKELAIALSELSHFEEANVSLEQYPTDGNLAAELLWDAYLKELITEKIVIDLGAGTGILAIGAALLGAKEVIAIEKDPAAVAIMKRNMTIFEGTENITLIEGDVRSLDRQGDLLIMNPPFGTKERHADRVFLEKAITLAPIIYTIHKSSTAKFVRGFAAEKKYDILSEAEWSFPLKKSMEHHTKEREVIEATLFLMQRK